MKLPTLGIVMAHHGTEETCERHIPFWMENCHRLMFFSPVDSVMTLAGCEHIAPFGRATHHGREANERFRHVIQQAGRIMEEDGYHRVVIHEYDSICVGELPVTNPKVIAGNAFKDDARNSQFVGSTFIHPPLIMYCDFTQWLGRLMENENMNGESGYWDRLLGRMTERFNIPVFNFRDAGLGYSQNTIQQHHHIEISTAKIQGARLFHGVKTEAALKVCTSRPSRRGGYTRPVSRRFPHGGTLA